MQGMRGVGRQEIAVLLFVLSCACVYGMKIDFSRLRQLRKPFVLEKRGPSNPCPADEPFLCKSQGKCIPLEYVCNNYRDCPDGFDEQRSVCNAKHRPPASEILDFLDRNQKWIIPKLFDGTEMKVVAHALTTSSNLDDFKMSLGISGETEENLHKAFEAVMEGDERPLLRLGMPEDEWYDVEYMLNRLLEGGFEV